MITRRNASIANLAKGKCHLHLTSNRRDFAVSRFSDSYPNYQVVDKDIDVEDINQGSLGDCYLMSVISAIAEYPDRILRILIQRNKSPFHAYCVALCIAGEFQEFYLDDKYYCKGNPYSNAKPLAFAHNDGEEIWAGLIEKAYAKAYGSYYDIEAGMGDKAFFDLTGAPSEEIGIEQRFVNAQGKVRVQTMTHTETEDLFTKMLNYDKKAFIMTAGTKGSGENDVGNGIAGGHA